MDHYNKVVLRGNTQEEVDPQSGDDNGLNSVEINLYKTRWDMAIANALWKEAQEDQRIEREAIERDSKKVWKRMQEKRKEEMQKEKKQREEKREMERRQALQK